jgi:hypothetical protein
MRRHDPIVHLPALLALALAATNLPARSQARLISLCGGGSLPIPATPSAPARDCDPACHVGRMPRTSGRI